MREQGIYESVIEHIYRLFATTLYGNQAEVDAEGRLRMDSWELRDSVQNKCKEFGHRLQLRTYLKKTDYA